MSISSARSSFLSRALVEPLDDSQLAASRFIELSLSATLSIDSEVDDMDGSRAANSDTTLPIFEPPRGLVMSWSVMEDANFSAIAEGEEKESEVRNFQGGTHQLIN